MLATVAGLVGMTTWVSQHSTTKTYMLTKFLAPGAKEIAAAYKAAGNPSQVRGFCTNVAGWNAWDLSPGEFSKATDAQWNKCQNEKQYVQAFSAALKTAGFPSQSITDTGRNAVQGLRQEWGNWCNVKGAGFGVRPTTETGEPLSDAFVWIKPGGESDGTSDTSATRYDSYCGKPDGEFSVSSPVCSLLTISQPSSLLLRPASGTRPTLRCFSRMLSRLSKWPWSRRTMHANRPIQFL